MRTLAAAILVFLLAASAAAPAGAGPHSPETVLEVGTSPLCAYHTIAAAIAAANPGDTIKVENTVFVENPLLIGKDLTLAGGYNSADPNGCLTLTGLNHTTVQPAWAGRTLAIQNATVHVTWFIFEESPNGGALLVQDGTLDMENAIVRNNSAWWGGGLSVVDAAAHLSDCEFEDNSAAVGGGALDIYGLDASSTVTLARVAFRRNQAGSDGGAIHIEDGSQVTASDWVALGIDGTTINHAGRNGGAVFIQDEDSRLTINADSTLSTLSSNTAGQHGGGIYVDGGQVILDGVLDPMFGERLMVSSNRADADGNGSGDGGGIYATGGATVQVDATYLFGNEAQNGGALFLQGSTLTGDDVRIQGNSAALQGGGLWAGGASTVLLSSGSEVGGWGGILPNDADEGGGLYLDGGSTATVDGSTITGNQGWQHGAGVHAAGGASFSAVNGSAIQRNQTPYGCYEGGGVYAEGPGTQVTIDAGQVMTNSALTSGGGLFFASGASGVVRNGTVVWDNTTYDFTGGGGGAYLTGPGTLAASNSVFRDNWSAADGGGILNDGGTLTLAGASVGRNHAHGSGGGIYNLGGTVQTSVAWIGYNEVQTGDGAGVYSLGGAVDVEGGMMVLNVAAAGSGGALAAHSAGLAVRRVQISGNQSVGEGTAMAIIGSGPPGEPVARVDNCFVVDNATLAPMGPPGSGSSVYVEKAVAVLRHNTVARQVQASFGVYAGDGSNVTLVNNIVANFVVGIRRPSGGTGVATASHTLYYDNLSDYDPSVTNTVPLSGDPSFVVPGDYHLTAASPAIDAGIAAGVLDDLDGDLRPLGLGYDIGADEYPSSRRLSLPFVVR